MENEELIVNGVGVGKGAGAGDSPAERSVDLPSGSRAVIRAGRGRDLMRAQRTAAVAGGAVAAVAMALIAELAVIDNERLVYEDVLELDYRDVLTLEAEILGNFTFPPRPGSPS
ncbi:MAG: hypothetical protein ACREQI_11105 [Candidatus Binataceae bacterium]